MVRWIGAVFLLALVVRVVYILEIDASPLFAHPAVDSLTYTQHAERLAAGNWLGRGRWPILAAAALSLSARRAEDALPGAPSSTPCVWSRRCLVP